MILRCRIAVVLACLSLLQAVDGVAAPYDITDLGPLPVGTVSDYANGLNGNGDAAGYVTEAGFDTKAMRWTSGGGFDVLGTLGGDSSIAFAINDSGVLVGETDTGVGFNTLPFRQSEGGVMQSLGSLGGDFGVARDINDDGQITGHSHDGSTLRAFIWEQGVGLTDIGNFTANGSSSGQGINSAGHIAGAGTTTQDEQHAFYWDGNMMTDLGTLGTGEQSFAHALNDSNMVVGYGTLTESGSTFGTFKWTSSGGIQQLDQLFSYDTRARDVNNDGDVVGRSWIDGMGNARAVIWPGSGAVVNLNDVIDPTSGWLLTDATGVNDDGQIVGVGVLDGASRAFLLTPVPEPSSMLLAVCGAFAVAGRLANCSRMRADQRQ